VLDGLSGFSEPLFRPGFLGDKWPAIDYYAQTNLAISTKKRDIERLLQIPGPTYIFGIHEPSKRVFVRSVHKGVAPKAINRIYLSYELTSNNLRLLHEEVRGYWATNRHKPESSNFT
jgi:hypothetical protein